MYKSRKKTNKLSLLKWANYSVCDHVKKHVFRDKNDYFMTGKINSIDP